MELILAAEQYDCSSKETFKLRAHHVFLLFTDFTFLAQQLKIEVSLGFSA